MSYSLRLVAAVIGGLTITAWQVAIGLREGNGARLTALAIGVGLTVSVIALVLYVRALPRRDIRKRIATNAAGGLFEARMDAYSLSQLGQKDVTRMTDLVIVVDDIGVHFNPAVLSRAEILVTYSEIERVEVSGDDDPSNSAGMVSLTISPGSRDLSLTLYAPFMWGAFPATPAATRTFVEAIRTRL